MSGDSVLDLIAKMTAKTVVSVREVYRETSEEARKTRAEQLANGGSHEPNTPFFAYGTSFSDIVQFTRDVEEFTRHIDTRTRKRTRET